MKNKVKIAMIQMKVESLKTQMTADNFAKFMRIKTLELSDGYAKTQMLVSEEFLNFFNAGHGASIYAVADVAFSLACNAQKDIERAVALNVSINFIKKVEKGDTITAEAKLTRKIYDNSRD